jgi:Beta-lactamase
MNENETKLSAALERIQGVKIDEAAIRAHVMRPQNVVDIISDRGREDAPIIRHMRPLLDFIYELDVNGFIQALETALNNSTAGYSLRLRQNGSTIYTVDWNWAHEPQDSSESWTPDVRMHVASCSKIVTAIAMTKLLNSKNLSYDTPIINYLPAYWTKGPNVDEITFAELMTHTSGLAFGNTTSRSDFEFMKEQIAAGTTQIGQYSYQNMNFGLCRILISTINGNIPVDWTIAFPFFQGLDDLVWDYVTLSAYQAYVNANLFAPSGVSGPTLYHETPDALAYNFPVSGNGWNSGNLATMAGGAGWHMSVDELLNVMGTFRRNGTIMSPAAAQTLLDDSFGIDWTMTTPLGTYYAKNGMWSDSAGHKEQSVAFYLPGEMELVLLVNSPVTSEDTFLYTVVSNAYTNNIVERIVLQ